MPATCTVCHKPALILLDIINEVPYWRCQRCEATLMAPQCWLDPSAEKTVYDLHDNDPSDAGYRRFLDRLATPLLERVSRGSTGLDFGCGPGPALSSMLAGEGLTVALYDPFYQPDRAVLGGSYDFITCTEVLEHLRRPRETLALLDQLLKPGGWLGVMTCFQTDDSRFANWHYRRDPTHIVFYRETTLAWIADEFQWSLHIPAKNVALFQKSSHVG